MTLPSPADFAQSSSRIRRTSRACLQCRARKQRCYNDTDSPLFSGPCQRCRNSGKVCSFETEDIGTSLGSARYGSLGFNPGPSNITTMMKIIGNLQSELAEHKSRLEVLEQAINITHAHGSPASSSSSAPSVAMKKHFDLDGATFSAPMTTLRDLPFVSEDEGDFRSSSGILMGLGLGDSLNAHKRTTNFGPIHDTLTNHIGENKDTGFTQSPDLITRGVLSMEEAQALFDIFFIHCHSLAPVLSTRIQRDASIVRHTSPILFTTVCSVGARFWGPQTSLHPRYASIVQLLDQAIEQLLLRATPSDVNVEAVQALLIYVQWMPLDVVPLETNSVATGPSSPSSSSSGRSSAVSSSLSFNISARGRFSDTSAWSVVGFAIRLATLLGLDRSVDVPFGSPDVTEEEMTRMRVWMNLLIIDHHLTLTTRLPTSLDPVPAARVARSFASNLLAEQNDIKIAAVCELVAVFHRATKSAGDTSLHVSDETFVQKMNAELNEWESIWTMAFSNNGFDHYNTQMPCTALGWARLASNFVSLGPGFFGPSDADETRTPCMSALRASVEAATSLLYSLALKDHSPDPSHVSPMMLDSRAVVSLKYSTDAHWLVRAFAVVFLAMAYERGVINDELSVVPPMQHNSPQMIYSYPTTASPPTSNGVTECRSSRMAPPQEASCLCRLMRLAVDVFANAAIQPPAVRYKEIVLNTYRALMMRDTDASSIGLRVADMFALIVEEGFEGSLSSVSNLGVCTGMPL